MSEFPLVKLSEVVRLNPRNPDVVPAETDLVTFIPMAAVEAETGRFDGSETRVWSAVKKGYTRFQENDVLVAKITPCMENGKACVARHLEGLVGAGSTEFHVLRSITSKVEPEWILRFVNQRCVRYEAKRHMSGAVGQQRVPASFYQDLQLPLPDLETQQELLERLEDHDVKIDATERALFAIQTKLKQARASILKAAVEGRLVETDIPWSTKPLRELLAEPMRNGKSAKTSTSGKGVRIATLTAVTANQFTESNTKPADLDPSELDDLWLQPEDIFVQRSNAPELVGSSAMYSGQPNWAIFPDLLIRVRCSPEILPKWMLTNLQAPSTRRYFKENAKCSSGSMPKISQSIIAEAVIACPSLKDQEATLEEIERRFSVLDQVEATVNASLRRCGQLRQAMLKSAFGG